MKIDKDYPSYEIAPIPGWAWWGAVLLPSVAIIGSVILYYFVD